MIHEINNPRILDKSVYKQIGRPVSEISNSLITNIGSCLYNLRDLKLTDKGNNIHIEQNARCNFELFEKGLLLRINDKQKFFVLPLSKDDKLSLTIIEGEEKISSFNLTGLLHALGVKRSFLRRFWLLSRGIYNERLELLIETNSEKILLDSNGKNFKGALRYFEKCELRDKLTTHNNKYKSAG
jgi:hypothetical protein